MVQNQIKLERTLDQRERTATMLNSVRRMAFINRLFHFYWRFARGLTLGVRGMVLDADNRVFLIKHTYVDGWQFPGGGVEAGESMMEALSRELMEEGCIEVTAPPKLHAMYFHPYYSNRDHVALYVIRDFRQTEMPKPNHEIAAHGFFALDDLPPDTTKGTRARIDEVFRGVAIPERW